MLAAEGFRVLRRYQELLGCAVEPCRFRVLRDDDVHGWLGASPDGLIASLTTQGTALLSNGSFVYGASEKPVGERCKIALLQTPCSSPPTRAA